MGETKRFHVAVQERWTRYVAVDAASEQEAMRLVSNGGGTVLSETAEYVEDMPPETWSAEEIDES